jgi:predicted GIY-YIG superfamily endonuclease
MREARAGSRPPGLKHRNPSKRKALPLSVQRRKAVEQRTAVYRFFNTTGELLYVGITNDPKTRFAYHARQKADTWWPLVERHTIDWYDNRTEAAAVEVAAIKTEAPLYNMSDKPSPKLVSTSAAVHISMEDIEACEWITPSDVARRVVELGIRKSLSRSRVMQLAETDPAWPVPRDQWRSLANMWLFPWPPVEEYFRTRVTRQGRRTDLGK